MGSSLAADFPSDGDVMRSVLLFLQHLTLVPIDREDRRMSPITCTYEYQWKPIFQPVFT